MRSRIHLGLAIATILILVSFLTIRGSLAGTTTANLSLSLPSVGASGWASDLNSNFTVIDGLFGSASGHGHTGSVGSGPKISLTAAVSGQLPVANGGCAGTTAATCRSNISAAVSGANSDITSITGLSTPLAVNQGGTASTTASAARSALGAAASGANSDITSLTGLTTPLSRAQGGTGSSSFTTGSVVFASSTLLTESAAGLFWDETNVRLGIATSTPGVQLEIKGRNTPTYINLTTYNIDTTGGGALLLDGARSNRTTPALVASGDVLPLIYFRGYDGSAYQTAAYIASFIDGTAAANNMPGGLLFATTLAGGITTSERMRITNAGNIGIGGIDPSAQLHVKGTGQTSSTPTTASSLGGAMILQDAAGGFGNGGFLVFGASQGYFAGIKGSLQSANSNTIGNLSFDARVAVGDATLTEVMRITGSTSRVSFPSGKLNIPNSATIPATCTAGDVYVDTSESSGRKFQYCDTANTWVVPAGSRQILVSDNLYDPDTGAVLGLGAGNKFTNFGATYMLDSALAEKGTPFPAGTLSNFAFVITPSLGGATCSTYTATVRVNGVASTLTCSVATTSTRGSCFDSDSVTLSAGDLVSVLVVDAGGTCTDNVCSDGVCHGESPFLQVTFLPS